MGDPTTEATPASEDTYTDNGAADVPARFGSMRDRLRARREELREQETLDLLVPGYDGDLGVRYRLMPQEESDKASKQAMAAQKQGDNRRARELMADFLIKSAEVVLVRDGVELEPLTDDGDNPVGFDQQLAEFLGFEADSAREVVAATFSPFGRNPDAIADHVEALGLWRRGRDNEIDGVLLGE